MVDMVKFMVVVVMVGSQSYNYYDQPYTHFYQTIARIENWNQSIYSIFYQEHFLIQHSRNFVLLFTPLKCRSLCWACFFFAQTRLDSKLTFYIIGKPIPSTQNFPIDVCYFNSCFHGIGQFRYGVKKFRT